LTPPGNGAVGRTHTASFRLEHGCLMENWLRE